MNHPPVLTAELLQQHNLYKLVLENCNDGINVVDVDGKIIFTNQISADYANATIDDMIGSDIFKFYPKAVLLRVLNSQQPVIDKKIHYIGNKKYIVSSFPIFMDQQFVGAFSVFKDIQDIESLNKRIKTLELQLTLGAVESDVMSIIGKDGTLKPILTAAKRTVGSLGGPRHSIIIGESGTGKTMLARLIHGYAVEVGVLDKRAPFVEINCAQYTNADIAAVDIFGSEEGAYTGSKLRKGLFEQANGGILFLDEAHALEHYQNILLKAVESGKIRRIGGSKEIAVDVIIIAASTKNLKDELLPELYQRLGQYELTLPSLSERTIQEKMALLHHFVQKYENAVQHHHGIQYSVHFSEEAQTILLNAHYPRNIRQMRDIINLSIDAASPLIPDVKGKELIAITVEKSHLPFTLGPTDTLPTAPLSHTTKQQITQLANLGYGPRRIASQLKTQGIHAPYYQIAYYLKKNQ